MGYVSRKQKSSVNEIERDALIAHEALERIVHKLLKYGKTEEAKIVDEADDKLYLAMKKIGLFD